MVHFLCKVNFKTSLYPQSSTWDAELLNLTGNLVFYKGRFSCFAYTMNRNVDFSCTEETRRYPFNAVNRLILILCCWLLKKALVITTNLTNPESASAFIYFFIWYSNMYFLIKVSIVEDISENHHNVHTR